MNQRVIKFRVWEKDLEQMLNWEVLERFQNLQSYLHSEFHEVMQFTGLHDKNGKEIYEGDIVQYDLYTDKIVFKHGGFQGERLIMTNWAACEVIGNIYENPELLK